MKIRVLIVDDELMTRQRLRRYLLHETDIETMADCVNGAEAVAAIKEDQPDIVFLDVQMPEKDGFQVIDEIGVESMPIVIFITAHEEFAIRAFEAQALDYLLKPFGETRFHQALRRARELLASRGTLPAQLADLALHLRNTRLPGSRLAVKSNGRVLFLRLEEIDWIEAVGDYVNLHVGQESHLLRARMSEMEKKLGEGRFFRIHRSSIVNLDRVKEFRPVHSGESAVVLRNGVKLAASRACAQKLQQALGTIG
ncbi:MAG TPA: LytTR family DNA-binding domain-containing protein [Verrucomicrobiae bacterium]|nr:LytTR family DNA-binding domain-containing protein [Verrucomicrobiae bacterium]